LPPAHTNWWMTYEMQVSTVDSCFRWEQLFLRSPGSPYSDTPTYFDEADLNNAIKLDCSNKRTLQEIIFGSGTC
jgi:hypothetical protein